MYNTEEAIAKLEEKNGIKFSEEQIKVLEHEGGQIVVSCAGSGKTTTLVNVVTKRILTGEIINPNKLLVTTYSKSGSTEVSNRINDGLDYFNLGNGVLVKTMHASYYQMLSRFNMVRPVLSNAMRTKFLREAVKGAGIRRLEENELESVNNLISFQINAMLSDEDLYKSFAYDIDLSLNEFKSIRSGYSSKKAPSPGNNNGYMDYDDMQYYVYHLLCVQKNQNFIDYCRNQWTDFYIDEFQDTSKIQFNIVQQLITDQNKLMVIGDDDQCLLPGSKIKTVDGEKNIEDITVGTKVISAKGYGETVIGEVEGISKKYVETKIYEIKTTCGKTITGTGNHVGFSRIDSTQNVHFVYLMYKADVGFELGILKGGENQKRLFNVDRFEEVLNQEGGDKLWILNICNNIAEAIYYESMYSYKNGIPQSAFKSEDESKFSNRAMHKELDTLRNGRMLLSELGLFEEYPHRVPQAGSDRLRINFSMFAGEWLTSTGHHLNRLSANSQVENNIEVFRRYLGENEQNIELYGNYLSARSMSTDYDRQFKAVQNTLKECEKQNIKVGVEYSAKLTQPNINYSFTPFSHMLVGMKIPVYGKYGKYGNIVESEISEINVRDYKGYVYDINVSVTRNYIANDVVVHNCIYSWRGADPSILLNLGGFYDELDKHFLNTNYRCKSKILNFAKTGVKNMSNREEKNMKPFKEGGNVEFLNSNCKDLYQMSKETFGYIKESISNGEKASDICVIVRNNTHGIVLNNMLMMNGIFTEYRDEMKMSYNMTFKDICNIIEMAGTRYMPDTNNAELVGGMLWKMVPYFGTKGSAIVKDLIKNTGVGLSVALAYILEKFLHIKVEEGCPSIPAISRVVESKTRDKCFFVKPEQAAVLKYIHDIIKITDRSERILKLIEIYRLGMEFTLKNPNTRREFECIVKYYKNMLLKDGEEVLENNIETTKNLENSKMKMGYSNVNITTAHSSKGMEWKHVIVLAYDNISFPSFRYLYDCFEDRMVDSDINNYIDGERRLSYVTVTRAIDKLTLITDFENMSIFGLEQLGIINKFDLDTIKETVYKSAKYDSKIVEKVMFKGNEIDLKVTNAFIEQHSEGYTLLESRLEKEIKAKVNEVMREEISQTNDSIY